jgi:hypothetical protein
MCFSAEADLIAGAVVGGAGLEALRHVEDRRQLAIATLPVVFGAHQVIEAGVWWGADGRAPACVADAATQGYLAIAFLLPLVVPLLLLFHEPSAARRRRIVPLALVGGVVAAILLADLWDGPVVTTVHDRYISYDVGLDGGGVIAVLYVAATCLPMLLVSNRRLRLFAVLNLAAVATLAWLLASGLISLWCAWAAVVSLLIVVEVRSSAARSRSAQTAAVTR